MSDGQTLPNFDDVSYFGLSDTGADFTGSSTLQDTTLGSPVQLDTTYGTGNASVTDAIDYVGDGSGSGGSTIEYTTNPLGIYPGLSNVPLIDSQVPQNTIAQSLSGVSSPPFASASQSTPTPNVAPPSDSTAAGLSALSKFGASFATLFSSPSPTVQARGPIYTSPAGGAVTPGAASSTTMLITLVVIGALILLLLRED